MELEEFIRMACKGTIPAASVPCPGDVLCAQFVTDGWHRLLRHQIGCWCIRWMRCVDGKRCIDGIAIRGDSAILHHLPVAIKWSDKSGRRIRKFRCTSTDHPEVIEE